MLFYNVLQVVGKLLIPLSFVFLPPAILAYYEMEDHIAFLECFGMTFLSGLVLFILSRKTTLQFTPKEGFASVVFSWVLLCVFGSFPYFLMDLGVNDIKFVDALFETVSGFTTTGSSVLQDIEALPKSLLLWRSLTQWIGGMGIILLFLAVLPTLGAGGFQLFRAEIPGPIKDKLSPKIRKTAIYLWITYIVLTILLFFCLLSITEMGWYDAICHSLTTISTGGYSTKNTSVLSFNSWKVDLIITLFMFLSSCNFVLLIQLMKGKMNKIIFNNELQLFVSIIFACIVFITIQHYIFSKNSISWMNSLRQAAFQVVTVVSSTGFATDDFDLWTSSSKLLVLALMMMGGCAGSTSGGMKVFRVLVIIKYGLKEIKRLIHPRAIINVTFDKVELGEGLVRVINGFLCLYVITIFISTFLLILFENGRFSGLGLASTSITCISNIGPGFNEFGPTDNFYKLSDSSKYCLSFLMLLGRLELFSILVLFHPDFWKR